MGEDVWWAVNHYLNAGLGPDNYKIKFKIFWMAEPSAGADPNGAKQSTPGAPHCREICENQVKGRGKGGSPTRMF